METQQEVTREARFYLFLCPFVCLFPSGLREMVRICHWSSICEKKKYKGRFCIIDEGLKGKFCTKERDQV
jgi:hypothetical protein